jgi:hypothetical protein
MGMNKRDKMNADYAKVQARLGKTTGASKGSKPAPKAKVSLKGTNPMKDKYAITIKKKF